MSLRKLSLTALAFAALSPSISLAGAEDHALKACVNAFAASLKGNVSSTASPVVKLNYARAANSPISDFYAQEFTFTMRANDSKSKSPIAAVSCSATQNGTVLALRTLQTPADGVKFASR